MQGPPDAGERQQAGNCSPPFPSRLLSSGRQQRQPCRRASRGSKRPPSSGHIGLTILLLLSSPAMSRAAVLYVAPLYTCNRHHASVRCGELKEVLPNEALPSLSTAGWLGKTTTVGAADGV